MSVYIKDKARLWCDIYHVFMEFYLIMKVEFYIMNWNEMQAWAYEVSIFSSYQSMQIWMDLWSGLALSETEQG